jgi:methionyl-tRNA synthetase
MPHSFASDDESSAESLPGRVLVTCALPYVNNVPHLGNLIPVVSADVYHRSLQASGIPSMYVCATDEHGTRTELEAAKAGLDEDTYCRQLHERMRDIFSWFHVSFTVFGRTSDAASHELTQQLFTAADANGYIEEQFGQQLYCESCVQYLPDTFVEGECPHCGSNDAQGDQCDACGQFLEPLELIQPHCKLCQSTPVVHDTKHLALSLQKLAPALREWLESRTDWRGPVRSLPLAWLDEGLRARCITRDLKWGIKVPKTGYEDKVFYVWFDAPIGYIGATKTYIDETSVDPQRELDAWWKSKKTKLVHFLGKDNIPFHTLMWPGTLLAAGQGWNLPDAIAANEYLTYDGQPFSKQRKQGVFSDDARELGVPADVFRFALMALRPEKRDSAFQWEAFQQIVNADLVGNIGNFANRVVSFVAKRFGVVPTPGEYGEAEDKALAEAEREYEGIQKALASFAIRDAIRGILSLSDVGNRYIQQKEPWRTFREEPLDCQTTLYVGCLILEKLARACWPVMPEKSVSLLSQLGCSYALPLSFDTSTLVVGQVVSRPASVLFARISDEDVAKWKEQFCGQ